MSATLRSPRLLLVGPLPSEGGPIGGTQVSFAEHVESLRASAELEVSVHSTSRARERAGRARRLMANGGALARTLRAVARARTSADAVAFHVSPEALLAAGPLVWAACRAIQKPLCIRVFGGSFDLDFDAAPSGLRALAERTFLCAELVLVQTTQLFERFGARANVCWLPTTRDLAPRQTERRRACKHFLFIGQMRPEKGITEALQASDALPPDARLDVYGPSMPGFDVRAFERHPRASYHGPLDPREVPRVLEEHDAFVFPTYYAGEGLPGAVIEAMQLGLPVLGTRWRSIPDLVAHEKNGLLVEPRDARGLADALVRLAGDHALYRALSGGALRTGDAYRTPRWHAQHERWLLDLCAGRPPSAGPSPVAIASRGEASTALSMRRARQASRT